MPETENHDGSERDSPSSEQLPAPMATLRVTGSSGIEELPIYAGKPFFVLGRNGCGKSALLHQAVRRLPDPYVYVPGARNVYFDADRQSMTAQARESFEETARRQDREEWARYRPWGGGNRNQKVIYDLQSTEVQFKVDAAGRIADEGATSDAIRLLQEKNSPIDQANTLLAQSNIPIRLTLRDAELMATRGDDVFSIAKMSDGERSALVLVAEVLTAKPSTVLVIDEPERHLHRSITVPMISALVAARPDCGFVFSTHEIDAPSESRECTILLVRDCYWNAGRISHWDVDLIEYSSEIPEDLRTDILGSRKSILFVEGESSSLDQPLYSLLFPSASVRTRRTCQDVERAVRGIRETYDSHRTEAYGIVDGDGMDESHREKLGELGIYALEYFSVESLYYCEPVVGAVADYQGKNLGLDTDAIADWTKSALAAALNSLGRHDDQVRGLAARVAERAMRDQLLRHIPTRRSMETAGSSISVSAENPYSQELDRLQKLLADGLLFQIVARYPVRYSHVLDKIAEGLRFAHRSDYEAAALARIASSDTLRNEVRRLLGTLADVLD